MPVAAGQDFEVYRLKTKQKKPAKHELMKYVVFSISLSSHPPPNTLSSSFYSTKAPLCTLQVEYYAKKILHWGIYNPKEQLHHEGTAPQ